MSADELVKEIEKDFADGCGMVSFCGYKDNKILDEVKQDLDKKGYSCFVNHETFAYDGVWPYQLTVFKSKGVKE